MSELLRKASHFHHLALSCSWPWSSELSDERERVGYSPLPSFATWLYLNSTTSSLRLHGCVIACCLRKKHTDSASMMRTLSRKVVADSWFPSQIVLKGNWLCLVALEQWPKPLGIIPRCSPWTTFVCQKVLSQIPVMPFLLIRSLSFATVVFTSTHTGQTFFCCSSELFSVEK